MLANSPEAVKEDATVRDGLIAKAYLYFYQAIADWLGGSGDETFARRLSALYETLTHQLNLVVIDLDAQDDAQVIFETLNALGTPLLPADLVKNYLFHSARLEEQDTQELYTRFWEAFDTDQVFWRRETTRGRLKRPQIDAFLQDYLTLMTGQDITVSHLFATFRDYAEQRPDLKAAGHLEQFHAYAGVYKKFEEYDDDTQEGVFFKRLDVMNNTTVVPLLLEVFRQHAGPVGRPEILAVIRDLESFFVRRMVCGMTTQSYARFFAEVISKLHKEGAFAAAAIRRLLLEQTAEASRWPDDAKFRGEWVMVPMYKKFSQSRVRMILQALDDAMRDRRAETIRVTGTLSIEHLLPQQWQQHWPLPTSREIDEEVEALTEEEAADWRNELLHTVGNLTLLTEKLNSSISNGPWPAKKASILRHSALHLNRRLHDIEAWGEQQIEDRSAELFTIATRVWPYPSSSTT
jgi:hypothetical protein